MTNALIWLALFVTTALTDYMGAKYVDSKSEWRRANLSAIDELIGLVSGFTIYAWLGDYWLMVPCIAGAWVGSYFAGVDKGAEIDHEFVEAVADAVALTLDNRKSEVS